MKQKLLMLMIALFALTAGTRAANVVKMELYDGLAVNDDVNNAVTLLVKQKVLTKSSNSLLNTIDYYKDSKLLFSFEPTTKTRYVVRVPQDVTWDDNFEYTNVTGTLRVAFSVAINETNFPDKNFQLYVIGNFDTKNDVRLSKAEATAVTKIDVRGKTVNDLTGIRYFTELQELFCQNGLEESESDNNLTKLNLSYNTKLTYIGCGQNRNLASLNISKCNDLENLYCPNCKLTTLNLQNKPKLWRVYCLGNQLETLDVSSNKSLQTLDCQNNLLTSLIVAQDTPNTGLGLINCYNNQLTTIDVTNLAGLKYLCCYCNNIKGAGLEALLNSLPDRTSDDLGDLQFIWVDNDQNYCTPRQVEIARAKNWKVSNIQGAEYPGADVVPGDANSDSVVNADDIVILCQYLLGLAPDCFEAEAADFNDDGDVNIEDITEIINTIVGE